MARQELTQERLKELLHYDPETGVFTRVSARPNVGHLVGRQAGCLNNRYVVIRIDGAKYKAHRLAFFYMTGDWPAEEVDHVNGECADNRWGNLRAVSHADNMKNINPSRNNSSGHVGVDIHPGTGKWRARISDGSRTIYLGMFSNLEDAINAYNLFSKSARKEYHRGQIKY